MQPQSENEKAVIASPGEVKVDCCARVTTSAFSLRSYQYLAVPSNEMPLLAAVAASFFVVTLSVPKGLL